MIPERGPRLLMAELSLFAVTLAVALGFTRLFDAGGWLLPLVIVAVAAHGIGAVMRRARIGALLQVLSTALATVLAMAWTQAPDTLRYWLPTGDTLAAFGTAFDEALTLYPEARAPTEPIVGFILAAMVGVAIIATMADIAAFRLGAEIQALVPPLTLFVFCSLLGSGDHRIVAAFGFTVLALLFVLVMRSFTRRSTTTWLPGDDQRGPGALVRVGSGLTAVAAIAAVVVAPALPGADDEPLWTWRGNDGSGERMVINPLVDIQARLVNQSTEVAFIVHSDEPTYHRMMSLDTFDGERFGMDGTFRSVGRNLRGSGGGPVENRLVQVIELQGLASPYLPAAFEPVVIDTGGEPVQWDDRTSTLLTETDNPPRGFSYTVESVIPDYEPEQLRAATGGPPPSVSRQYLGLPELDPRVVELAEQITSGAASPYDRALALQNHLRQFEYSLTVPSGHSDSALARFLLEDQAGYCEQFSTAFAAMARVVGLPSRVAVGFTVGDESPSNPGVYTVRGEHAHAWPEIWLSGVGWVPFEPTPGRGDPQSTEHTGVEPQQAGSVPETTTTTTTPGDLPSTTFDPSLLPDFNEGAPGAGGADSGSGGIPAPLIVGGVVVAVVGGWLLLVSGAVAFRHALRRRKAGDDPSAQIQAAWFDVVDAARSLRLTPAATETHREFARRLVDRAELHIDPVPLTRLAEQAAAARYGMGHTLDAESAWSTANDTIAELRAARSGRQQTIDRIDLRRAFPRRTASPRRRQATVFAETTGSAAS